MIGGKWIKTLNTQIKATSQQCFNSRVDKALVSQPRGPGFDSGRDQFFFAKFWKYIESASKLRKSNKYGLDTKIFMRLPLRESQQYFTF